MHPPLFPPAFRDDLIALMTWRRDVRSFRREPLPDGTLERLVAIACLAPSVGLSEPWRFVTVDDPGRRAAVKRNFEAANARALADQETDRRELYARLKLAGLQDAPLQIAVFADHATPQGFGLGRRTMPEAVTQSVVIAIHTLWLAARADGIGMGWVSILDPGRMAADLDVPGEWRFVGYVCLGYPAEEDDRPTLERAGWESRRDPACRIIRR